MLLLAKSQMLQPKHEGKELGNTNSGLISREHGHLMPIVIVTQHQVGLAQALISHDCRQMLLPVVQGQLFGLEA